MNTVVKSLYVLFRIECRRLACRMTQQQTEQLWAVIFPDKLGNSAGPIHSPLAYTSANPAITSEKSRLPGLYKQVLSEPTVSEDCIAVAKLELSLVSLEELDTQVGPDDSEQQVGADEKTVESPS